MTHKDIYTKFMIEYDKANVTSSYPSLTEYEVATVLDKAYQALIAQKVTGNNVRRSTFESDIKSIADLGPLTKTESKELSKNIAVAPNALKCTSPGDMLYFLQATMTDYGESYVDDENKFAYERFGNYDYNPIDGVTQRKLPVKLVNHEAAQKFFASAYNIPWIKNPVCYLENQDIVVVYDPLSIPDLLGTLDVVYIKKPHTFVKDINNPDEKLQGLIKNMTYFQITWYSDDEGYLLEHAVDYATKYTIEIVSAPESLEDVVDIDEEFTDTLPSEDSIVDGGFLRQSELMKGGLIQPISSSTIYQYAGKYFKLHLVPLLNETAVLYLAKQAIDKANEAYIFECNDTVAEELISLAVAFALENVESSRLNSKLNMRGLEA